MAILIAEDNVAQRAYLRELLGREFGSYSPILEAADGETVIKLA
ncbi:MAG: response regulator, partial [Acidobacteria bacterium]|nr:response regulator [Acidobacteriota bacterium]